jgi:hypothetical protein
MANEPVKKNPGAAAPAANNLPGVPVGNSPAQTLPAAKPVVEDAGLAGGKDAAAKKPFGGNVGRKTRADGLKPGSPEALAADRAADAARKREARAKEKLVAPPPALPAATPPPVDSVAATPDAPTGPLVTDLGDPVLAWSPDDFRQCATELVELAEAWRIDCHTKHAAEGKLPAPVVKEIANGAAFPPGSKKSLSTSSPVTLAKMFNALKVPLAVKPVITTAPALAYIIVRDLQTSSRIEKLIAEHGEHLKQNAAAKN